MVKLIWKNKKDIYSKLEDLKDFPPDFFYTYEFHSINSNKERKTINNSKLWMNKLFWGDNLEVLLFLLNNLKEKIDLIYIDPPFFSGINYQIKIKEEDK